MDPTILQSLRADIQQAIAICDRIDQRFEKMDRRFQALPSSSDPQGSPVPVSDRSQGDVFLPNRSKSSHRDSDRPNPEGFPDRPRNRMGEAVPGLLMTPDGSGGRPEFRSAPLTYGGLDEDQEHVFTLQGNPVRDVSASFNLIHSKAKSLVSSQVVHDKGNSVASWVEPISDVNDSVTGKTMQLDTSSGQTHVPFSLQLVVQHCPYQNCHEVVDYVLQQGPLVQGFFFTSSCPVMMKLSGVKLNSMVKLSGVKLDGWPPPSSVTQKQQLRRPQYKGVRVATLSIPCRIGPVGVARIDVTESFCTRLLEWTLGLQVQVMVVPKLTRTHLILPSSVIEDLSKTYRIVYTHCLGSSGWPPTARELFNIRFHWNIPRPTEVPDFTNMKSMLFATFCPGITIAEIYGVVLAVFPGLPKVVWLLYSLNMKYKLNCVQMPPPHVHFQPRLSDSSFSLKSISTMSGIPWSDALPSVQAFLILNIDHLVKVGVGTAGVTEFDALVGKHFSNDFGTSIGSAIQEIIECEEVPIRKYIAIWNERIYSSNIMAGIFYNQSVSLIYRALKLRKGVPVINRVQFVSEKSKDVLQVVVVNLTATNDRNDNDAMLVKEPGLISIVEYMIKSRCVCLEVLSFGVSLYGVDYGPYFGLRDLDVAAVPAMSFLAHKYHSALPVINFALSCFNGTKWAVYSHVVRLSGWLPLVTSYILVAGYPQHYYVLSIYACVSCASSFIEYGVPTAYSLQPRSGIHQVTAMVLSTFSITKFNSYAPLEKCFQVSDALLLLVKVKYIRVVVTSFRQQQLCSEGSKVVLDLHSHVLKGPVCFGGAHHKFRVVWAECYNCWFNNLRGSMGWYIGGTLCIRVVQTSPVFAGHGDLHFMGHDILRTVGCELKTILLVRAKGNYKIIFIIQPWCLSHVWSTQAHMVLNQSSTNENCSTPIKLLVMPTNKAIPFLISLLYMLAFKDKQSPSLRLLRQLKLFDPIETTDTCVQTVKLLLALWGFPLVDCQNLCSKTVVGVRLFDPGIDYENCPLYWPVKVPYYDASTGLPFAFIIHHLKLVCLVNLLHDLRALLSHGESQYPAVCLLALWMSFRLLLLLHLILLWDKVLPLILGQCHGVKAAVNCASFVSRHQHLCHISGIAICAQLLVIPLVVRVWRIAWTYGV